MFKHLAITIIFFISPQIYASSWTNYMSINANYFEGNGSGHQIVLDMNTSFHNCGWNGVGNINLSVVGPDAFKTYTSIILSAIVSKKQVAFKVDGCQGTRAKVVGLRLAK